MQESRQLPRAKLAEAITRNRHLLYLIKITEDTAPQSLKDMHTSRVQEITKELHEMEAEYHKLNVEQIREESKGG